MTARPAIAPEIHTERLVLRAPAESDLPAMIAFGTSPRTRFVGGPMDAFAAWRALLANIGHWTLRGYGFFSVDLAETGAFVGRIGVIFHPGWDEPELAWHLFDGFEGQGYCTEAARAARNWYHGAVSARPLISYIDETNAPSQAVARRLGARPERPGTVNGGPVTVWRHPGPEVAA